MSLPVHQSLRIDFDTTEQDFLASMGLLDLAEMQMMDMPPVETPLEHRFTPGLYIREITMYAGSLVASKIHRTTHPFVISKGDVSVWTEGIGTVRLKAPYTGITTPGTRRLLFIHEDTVWTTFHVTDTEDLEEIENNIIQPHINLATGLTHREMAKIHSAHHDSILAVE